MGNIIMKSFKTRKPKPTVGSAFYTLIDGIFSAFFRLFLSYFL